MPQTGDNKITLIQHPHSKVEYYHELLEIQNKLKYYSQFSLFEIRLLSHGFVKITDVDSSILIDLRYLSSRNVWNQPLYTNLSYAFLHKEVAGMLCAAQKICKEIDSSYSLIVYDALRQHSVQKKM